MNYNWSSAYFDAHIDNVSSTRRSNVVLVTIQLDLTSHLRACLPALLEKRDDDGRNKRYSRVLVVWDNPGKSRDPVPSDTVLSRIPKWASGRDGTNL
eukprot:scaffold12460_cov67-Skeletonema_dohrnii-CCMP3373.AAC.1